MNKVNPIMSVTLALVQGTSTTPSHEASHDAVRRSTLRTSMSDTEVLSSTFATPKRDATLPGTVDRESFKSENSRVRKTKSASEASGVRFNRDALNIKPKFSQDSKMRQVGYVPMKVQGFLNPSRKGSYYHSDDNLNRKKPSSPALSARSRSSVTFDPVTFTALEKLQVLDPGSLDHASISKRRLSVSPRVPGGGQVHHRPLNAIRNRVPVGEDDNNTTCMNTEMPNAHCVGVPSSNNVTPEIHIVDSGCSIQTGVKEGDGEESKADSPKAGTSVGKPTAPKRPTRRTAVVDIVHIHDFDGGTTRAKVASEEIVGDICVMNKESRERGKRKKEQRTAKRTAVIIVAFLCCWTPLLVSIMTSVVLDTGSHDAVRVWCEAYLVTLTLALFAAVINPVIYGVINNQFRSALIRMLKGFRTKWCKKGK